MPYIRYEVDPDDPEWTAMEAWKAYLTFFIVQSLGLASIGSVIYYIYSVVLLFKCDLHIRILYSGIFITVMAACMFMWVTRGSDMETRKSFAKKYFLFFFGGVLDVAGVIGIIISILSLCHDASGVFMLILSVFGIIIITLSVILIYCRIKGKKIRLFTPEEERLIPASESKEPFIYYIYCHKCGKKMLSDSEFCSSCGIRLKRGE